MSPFYHFKMQENALDFFISPGSMSPDTPISRTLLLFSNLGIVIDFTLIFYHWPSMYYNHLWSYLSCLVKIQVSFIDASKFTSGYSFFYIQESRIYIPISGHITSTLLEITFKTNDFRSGLVTVNVTLTIFVLGLAGACWGIGTAEKKRFTYTLYTSSQGKCSIDRIGSLARRCTLYYWELFLCEFLWSGGIIWLKI